MPASCSAGRPSLLLEMLSSPGNARSLHWSYIHTLGTPIHLRSQSLKSLSAIWDIFFSWFAALPCSLTLTRLLERRATGLRVQYGSEPLRCLWERFRHHYTPGNVGNPCYGEACARGTGRVLPQAMALQQIVWSREDAVGERQVRKKASRQYQIRYKCWRRRWKKLFAPWRGVSCSLYSP